MGVREGVELPEGVGGFFVQYMDDYLKPEHREFASWVFGEYIEEGLKNVTLRLGKTDVIGGLKAVQRGLDQLRQGDVRGKKLVIAPHVVP